MNPVGKSALFAAAAFAAAAASPARAAIPGLKWSLDAGVSLSGSMLTAMLDDPSGTAYARATIDISDCLGEDTGAAFSFRMRGFDIAGRAAANNGVKAMIVSTTASGTTVYPQVTLPDGSFDWTNGVVRVNFLRGNLPANGTVMIAIGLEKCTGRAEFDLSALSLVVESLGIERVNEDYIVRYPSCSEGECEAPHSRTLRGCMSPQRAMTEDDVATLASWGSSLIRFQICRNFGAVDDNRDLDEYAAWVDSRLDNLADVLAWAAPSGMKVAVDLHVVPGGVNDDGEPNLLHDATCLDAFVETWRRIATRCAPLVQTLGPVLYGYDLINEPRQQSPAAAASYWEAQRLAAEAIRAIDPDTPIIVESNGSASAGAFRYLSPLAMDNVIYEFHLYTPDTFTHQGTGGRAMLPDVAWPDASRGWDIDFLRRAVEPVRAFQTNHQCRIYVGEFSAAAWAQGAENWLRDAIAVFEDYGWDWTYHAFRESGTWSVEREWTGSGTTLVASSGNPRKQALLDGLFTRPDTPWFSTDAATGGQEGGAWEDSPANAPTPAVSWRIATVPGGEAAFSATESRDAPSRIEGVVTFDGGFTKPRLDTFLAAAVARGAVASLVCVEEDDGSLALHGLGSTNGVPAYLRLDGFAPEAGVECSIAVEFAANQYGAPRVSYLAGGASSSGEPLSRLRSSTGDRWFDSAASCAPVAARPGDSPHRLSGRVAFSGTGAVAAIAAAAPEPTEPPIVFGAATCAAGEELAGATATVEVESVGAQVKDGARLRMTVYDSDGAVLGAVERPLDGAGTYLFDTSGAIPGEAFADALEFRAVFSLVHADGTAATSAPTLEASLPLYLDAPWFSARGDTGKVKGGQWNPGDPKGRPILVDGAWGIGPEGAVFAANEPRGGIVRVETVATPAGGIPKPRLETLLAVAAARGTAASVVCAEEDDGSLTLYGLASVDGEAAWMPLQGGACSPGEPVRIAAEFDYNGATPRVSYLVGRDSSAMGPQSTSGRFVETSLPATPLPRLRSLSGDFWFDSPVAARPETSHHRLAGRVEFSGGASILSLAGTYAAKAIPPEPFSGTLLLLQ